MVKLTFRNNDVFDLIAKNRCNAKMYSLLDTNIKYANNEYKEYCNKKHGFSFSIITGSVGRVYRYRTLDRTIAAPYLIL